MSGIMEMARSLGNALARTDEYQALKRAASAADDDREIAEQRSTLERLEGTIATALRAGQDPDAETAKAYEDAVTTLQANATYQRLVAAQTNFDKVVQKVNETIARGLDEGADSRIILT
ncbi:MAG: YlbF family regulator [Gemmatimonadetes bacterium]|nr:YlbF family regulator [Gemmatimonadota bacterium]